MSNTSWVNAMRAETLAKLYLTRRRGLDVLTVSGSSGRAGYDLLVRVKSADTATMPEFGVETKGTSQPLNSSGWRSNLLKSLMNAEYRGEGPILPICLFVFNIDTEKGLYAWIYEPIVESDGNARIDYALRHWPNDVRSGKISNVPPLQNLDNSAIDHIVDRVIQWYRARDEVVRH